MGDREFKLFDTFPEQSAKKKSVSLWINTILSTLLKAVRSSRLPLAPHLHLEHKCSVLIHPEKRSLMRRKYLDDGEEDELPALDILGNSGICA